MRIEHGRIYKFVRKNTNVNDVIVSDIAHKISLMTNRRSVRLPYDIKEIMEINNNYLKLDYLIIGRGKLRKYLKNDKHFKDGILFNKFKHVSAPFKRLLVFKGI